MIFVSTALHFLWANKWIVAYSLLEHGLGKTEVGSAIGLAIIVLKRILRSIHPDKPAPTGSAKPGEKNGK